VATEVQLSPSEKVLLEGNHDFSKAKARYLRYRINKKLKLIESRDAAAAAAAAAATAV
jgi:hypothetical protein